MKLIDKKISTVLSLTLVGLVCCGDYNFAMQDNDQLREKIKEQVKQQPTNPFVSKQAATPQESASKDVVVTKQVESQKQSTPSSVTTPSVSSAATAPTQEKPKPTEKTEQKDIFLNFENTELLNFVNYIAELKNINLIPDKAIEGVKISLTIRHPLTVEGAYRIFLTVLEMAGFSIVQVGDIYEVILKDKSGQKPLPSFINVPVDTLPDSDLRIRYVVFLQNIGVASVKGFVESMLSDKAVVTYDDGNGFILTDKSYNIKSAVRLLQELDATGQSEAVVVIKLKNVNASEVKELLNALIKDDAQNPLAKLLGKTSEGSGKYFPPGTKVVSEERTNSLILMGVADTIKKIEEFIVNHVDTSLKATESPLHLYELQYTDAEQIATLLSEVTKPPEGGPGAKASQYGAVRGGVKYFKSMNFGVDKDGNRLIVSSTDQEDWELLKKTIQDLDKPQPQVAIETLLVSINAKDIKQLGGTVRNKKHSTLGHVDFQSVPFGATTTFAQKIPDSTNTDSPISLLGNMLSQAVGSQGSSILTFGRKTNIWGMFEAIKTLTNATLLSQPFMTVANKTPAKIVFGETRRVQQEQGSDQTGYIPVNANTSIEVTPQINLDGIIRMDITIGIEDFSDPKVGDKNTKKLKTNVTMADGQVLILGGFVQSRVSHTKSETPLLAKIPLLGWFFKSEEKRVEETYIFIFMAPNIIKPRKLPGMGLYTKMKLHQATEQIEKGVVTSKTKDPIFNWYFNPEKVNYSHKVIDYANARYQPTTVDIRNDPYYRSNTQRDEEEKSARKNNLKNDRPKMQELEQEEFIEADEVIVAHEEQPALKSIERKEVQEHAQKTQQAPLAAESNTQDRILKRLQERRQEVMRGDNDLEQRRTRLKDVVTKVASPQVQENRQEQNSEKRAPFKEFFSVNSPVYSNQEALAQEALTIDADKRNRLKDFLSKNQDQRGSV